MTFSISEAYPYSIVRVVELDGNVVSYHVRETELAEVTRQLASWGYVRVYA